MTIGCIHAYVDTRCRHHKHKPNWLKQTSTQPLPLRLLLKGELEKRST